VLQPFSKIVMEAANLQNNLFNGKSVNLDFANILQ
jgi:hypothetical protein